MHKIVSFGDSFILGNELARCDGTLTWPGLIASDLGLEYTTRAQAGCGNEAIARQIYDYFQNNPTRDTLAVINWTWCMRWDFFLPETDRWVTLGPSCVPSKLEDHIGIDRSRMLIDFYQDYIGRGDIWNRFRSAQTVYAAQCWLRDQNILSVETYMDPSIIDSTPGDRLDHYCAVKDPSWPDVLTLEHLDRLPKTIKQEVDDDYARLVMPDYVIALQNKIRGQLKSFDGQTFLEWSADRGFAITDLLHPLESAHEAAADHWRNLYLDLLK